MERMRRQRVSRLTAAVVALVVAAGCGLGGNDAEDDVSLPVPTTIEAVEPSDEPVESAEPVPSGTRVSPSPTVSRTPTGRPTRKPAKKATTAPTEDPNNFQKALCADYDGKAVGKSKAKAALHQAAGKVYWPGSAPTLKVPARLVDAIAWHESGFQSNIVNCDGGYGLMQVMPDTVTYINGRFEQSYDKKDYRQNAMLGTNYLAWLTRKFGDSYFQKSYDLSAGKCRSATDLCLLNMVIAGYNAGDGGVEQGYANGELPNPEYVRVVRALMQDCYCERY